MLWQFREPSFGSSFAPCATPNPEAGLGNERSPLNRKPEFAFELVSHRRGFSYGDQRRLPPHFWPDRSRAYKRIGLAGGVARPLRRWNIYCRNPEQAQWAIHNRSGINQFGMRVASYWWSGIRLPGDLQL